MQEPLIYVPKYIRQESDLFYGEKVTHENYNQKLNLLVKQGDYNTEVLDNLLNAVAGGRTYQISYLDFQMEEFRQEMLEADTDFTNRIDALEAGYESFTQDVTADINAIQTGYTSWVNANASKFNTLTTAVSNIVNGPTKTKHSMFADKIAGIDEAGARKYYGTDKTNNQGFHYLPPLITTEEFTGNVEVDGVYIVPSNNSITEAMLTQVLREKINRETISDYDVLDNRPKIAGITLTGDKTLNDLGIQPVGSYLTAIPDTYVQRSELNPYYKTADAQAWVNTQLSSYATASALTTEHNSRVAAINSVNNTLSTKVNNLDFLNYKNEVLGRHTVVQVGTAWNWNKTNPKTGDLLISV